MFSVELAQASIRLTVPLLYGALGELLAERAGVLNVALEGTMLVGAFGGVMGAYASGSAWVGLASAIVASVLFAAVFAAPTVLLGADQIVSGAAMNLVAFGLTGFLYRAAFGATGAALTVPSFGSQPVPFLSEIPMVGPLLFDQNVLVYAAFLLVPVLHLVLYHTWFGLALRAAGENPDALEGAGVSVRLTRFAALLAQGVLTGAGAAYLSLVHSQTFVEGMTAGRGFVAIAIVVSGRWVPAGTLAVSLLFGATMAVQFQLQASGLGVPYQFIRMVPYLATLSVLAGVSRGRAAAPAALGRPYRPA